MELYAHVFQDEAELAAALDDPGLRLDRMIEARWIAAVPAV